MCRWPNGDVSFVSARTNEDAIVLIDVWDDPELAEIHMIDSGSTMNTHFKEFGENCRDAIIEKMYPCLLEALRTELVTDSAQGNEE